MHLCTHITKNISVKNTKYLVTKKVTVNVDIDVKKAPAFIKT